MYMIINFLGNARVITPGTTACIECTLDLYPPQLNFPMCTLAHTPRLPEHCVEYIRVLLWPQVRMLACHDVLIVFVAKSSPLHIGGLSDSLFFLSLIFSDLLWFSQ